MNSDPETNRRFQRPPQRRDFLGLAAAWSGIAAVAVAVLGAMRLPIPLAFPESSRRLKLGPLALFQGVAVTPLPEERLWVFSDAKGLYAVSSVCTHLGCVVTRNENGSFFCPCHGSRFDSRGRVVKGPAPKGLVYLDLSVSPDGQLVVDHDKETGRDIRLQA
ncbi:MAG: ubiquinol-cytochrome c reductase iron-sulfur subunit [Pirellulaceae bacterium]